MTPGEYQHSAPMMNRLAFLQAGGKDRDGTSPDQAPDAVTSPRPRTHNPSSTASCSVPTGRYATDKPTGKQAVEPTSSVA